MKYKLVVRVEGTKTYLVDSDKHDLNDVFENWWKWDQIQNPINDTVDETFVSLKLIEKPNPIPLSGL